MDNKSFLKDYKIAHKGLYDNTRIYENTISAFERAIKYNYIIELDVRMLACGTLIVFQDENLERLLHVDELIEKITYDELCYLAKYQIPKFETVLDLVHGKVPLLIEIKSKTKKHAIEVKVAELLDNYDGLFAIQSFNYSTVKWFYKKRKDWMVGYLIDESNSKKEFFHKKYDFLNVNIHLFSDKKIRKLREDKVVLGYTINSLEEYKLKVDVYDNLVCNNLLEIDKR